MASIPSLSPPEFWQATRDQGAIDVRSPAEFRQGHISAAISLPLFDDQQRSEIGTLYKHQGRQAAVLRGLEMIGRNQSQLVKQVIDLANRNAVYIHCWRGGMRSASLAQIVQLTGVNPHLLEGGYKAFRGWARRFFEFPWKLVVVSGLTGVGKTNLLHALERVGEQVLDLEGLANHRGSAFGAIGLPPQPTTEQFENLLFERLVRFDPERVVWLEDEASRVGKVVIPDPLYVQLRHAPAYFVQCSRQRRIETLVADYGKATASDLEEALTKIGKRMDGQKLKTAMAAIHQRDFHTVADLALEYYDKRYQVAVTKIPRKTMIHVDAESMSDHERAIHLIQLAQDLFLRHEIV